ncbi:hypothetical protein Niako_3344 [Niastella koreensis GR20-10]|uniref:Uncharacterized protein n=1 Tax=Niastella koreensis (strain DSM 17620 / KACC 11465 / NBRC 106392 / GR20-10) TaxID=700598 RepID=G8TJC0_NIAKG|nr:hypothetical protein Niako_3344 [Niastella koreensis GR20-10]
MSFIPVSGALVVTEIEEWYFIFQVGDQDKNRHL